jgi:hypothetical protein
MVMMINYSDCDNLSAWLRKLFVVSFLNGKQQTVTNIAEGEV